MASKTRIGWTDRTFNAWMGCTKVSGGCKNCYAETFTKNRMGLNVWGPQAPRQRTKGPWKYVHPRHREADAGEVGADGVARRLLVFTGSMMDWAEDLPELKPWRDDLWDVIRRCPNLNFQMLTKRPENIRRMLPRDWGHGWPNVWMGTSVEDMRVAHRIDRLAEIPAAVRFVSYEPALGSLREIRGGRHEGAPECAPLYGIDWVIYGGESGPGFRPEGTPGNPKLWAREMRDMCATEGVAFFHKQSAAYRNESGIELDGDIIHEFPIPRQLPYPGQQGLF